MNRRGVAMAEAICTLTMLAGIAVASFQYARVAVARLWLDHHLYQGLVCAAEGKNQNFCREFVESKVKQSAFTTDKLQLDIWKADQHWEGIYQWSGYGGVTIQSQMIFELPKAKKASFLPW